MENIFSRNSQNNHVCSNDLDKKIGMSEPPDVEYDYVSKDNSWNSFVIGVVEDKNIEILPTTNAADQNVEVRAETSYGEKKSTYDISK